MRKAPGLGCQMPARDPGRKGPQAGAMGHAEK